MSDKVEEVRDDTNKVSYMIDLESQSGDPFTSITKIDHSKEPIDKPADPPPVEEVVTDPPPVDPPPSTDDVDDPKVDTEGVVDTEGLTPDSEEEGSVNPYFYLAKQLKEDKFLKEDFEVPEEIDGGSVYSLYRQTLQESLEPQIRQSVYSKLADEGINERDLYLAKAIRQGVDLRLLDTASMHERYASLEEDAPITDKKTAVEQMYLARGLKETEIPKLIGDVEDEETFNPLFEEAKQFHDSKYNEFVLAQSEYEKQQRARDQAEAESVDQLIKNTISSRKIMGENLTPEQAKEFQDAIYNPTRVASVDGTNVAVTELQEFLIQWNQSPELRLYMFKKYKYRNQDAGNIKKQAKQEVESDFMKAYKKEVSKDSKASKSKKVKEQLETNKAKSNTYFVDFSNK